MTKRERLLAALLAERFDTAAIESEEIELVEVIRDAQPILDRLLSEHPETDEQRGARRADLLSWPEPTTGQIQAVRARPRPKVHSWLSLVGQPRSAMDPQTLALVRAADAERKRIARRAS